MSPKAPIVNCSAENRDWCSELVTNRTVKERRTMPYPKSKTSYEAKQFFTHKLFLSSLSQIVERRVLSYRLTEALSSICRTCDTLLWDPIVRTFIGAVLSGREGSEVLDDMAKKLLKDHLSSQSFSEVLWSVRFFDRLVQKPTGYLQPNLLLGVVLEFQTACFRCCHMASQFQTFILLP
jgi:hypothetical protein